MGIHIFKIPDESVVEMIALTQSIASSLHSVSRNKAGSLLCNCSQPILAFPSCSQPTSLLDMTVRKEPTGIYPNGTVNSKVLYPIS